MRRVKLSTKKEKREEFSKRLIELSKNLPEISAKESDLKMQMEQDLDYYDKFIRWIGEDYKYLNTKDREIAKEIDLESQVDIYALDVMMGNVNHIKDDLTASLTDNIRTEEEKLSYLKEECIKYRNHLIKYKVGREITELTENIFYYLLFNYEKDLIYTVGHEEYDFSEKETIIEIYEKYLAYRTVLDEYQPERSNNANLESIFSSAEKYKIIKTVLEEEGYIDIHSGLWLKPNSKETGKCFIVAFIKRLGEKGLITVDLSKNINLVIEITKNTFGVEVKSRTAGKTDDNLKNKFELNRITNIIMRRIKKL